MPQPPPHDPTPRPPIASLAFLTPGSFPDDDPWRGLEDTLQLFEFGERLGYDGAWIRQRHLEHGVSSGAVFLAAASQRTRRIELGTAVIPIGYESPFRLAEDLATADVLARGRLQAGFSAGPPRHVELIGELVHDGDWRGLDFSYGRLERLMAHLRSEPIGGPDVWIEAPGSRQRPRMQPHSAGLVDRIWYGAGSLASARWAGAAGVNLLVGNVISAEGIDDFACAQRHLIDVYTDAGGQRPPGRIAVGRVVVPTDSADATARRRYRAFGRSRHDRTLRPQVFGGRRTLFAPDLIGPADEIAERLAADAAVASVTELRFELPYEFAREDYEQILHDCLALVGPALGRRRVQPLVAPATAPVARLGSPA